MTALEKKGLTMEEFNNDDILILLKKALAINATATKNKAAQEESAKDTDKQKDTQTKPLPNIQCSDILLGLEKMDENFHKYAFVKKLQERVSNVVFPILESQLKINDDEQTNDFSTLHQQSIVEKILVSPNYTKMVSITIQECKAKVNEIIKLKKNTSIPPAAERHDSTPSSYNQDHYSNSTSEFPRSNSLNSNSTYGSSVFSSTSNIAGGGGYLPGFEDMGMLLKNMRASNHPDIRFASIQVSYKHSSAKVI